MIAASGRFDLAFTCKDSTGAPVAPTGTPTGTLVKNGSDLGTTVTVTMVTSAQGVAACTIPSDAANGDRFYLRISAVISGVTYVVSGPVATVVNDVLLRATTHTGATIPTVTNLTNAPTNGDLTAAMKASVTAAVPSVTQIRTEMDTSSTQLAAILAAILATNNLSSLANLFGPGVMEIPASGSSVFKFTLAIKDQEGKAVNLDALPTITVTNPAGTSRAAGLSSVTNSATGEYTFTYTQSPSAVSEQLTFKSAGTVSGEARPAYWVSVAADYDTTSMLTAISAALALVQAKTDNLPSDPASQSLVETAIDGINTGSSMTGAYSVTITVTDGTSPVPGAFVRLKAGAAEDIKKTDGDGVVVFSADDNTYSVRITADRLTFTPVDLVVSGDTTASYSMTEVSIDETAWADGSDLVVYHDAMTIGQMLKDDRTAVDASSVPTHPIVGRLLSLATGEVNSALSVSKRYTTADLAAMPDSSLETLRWLTCSIAMWHLRQRRVTTDPERQARERKILDDYLDRIRRGELCLDIEANKEAGIGEAVPFEQADTQRGTPLLRDRMSGTAGAFPKRRFPQR